jgi:TolB-like protein/DNA-binding winged helix-turn-helix (wHTH) protein/tetratricopeptide (TPR) repeat protein
MIKPTESASLVFHFADVEVHEADFSVTKAGMRLALEPKPLRVLLYLLHHTGRVVRKDELLDAVWGDTAVTENSLTRVIALLRRTLSDDAREPHLIETVATVGYRFMCPVVCEGQAPSPPNASEWEPVAGPSLADASEGGSGSTTKIAVSSRASPRRRLILALGCGAVAATLALFAFNVAHVRDGLLALLFTDRAAIPRIDSIVVLPLENLSNDPQQEYFADGLTDALINDLGQILTMRVISRTSALRYKGEKKSLPQIARELNVDAAVEGTVQRAGGRVRISVQLLDARTDRHLWAESYERDLVDVVGLERQVALAIAHEISGRLSPGQQTKLATGRPVNLKAYDAYLRGRSRFAERTPESEADARGYFEEALREDPNFALADSGLADYYSTSWFLNANYHLAKQYARRAIALDPDLAEGHASLGIAEVYDREFADAEKELRRALALNPNYSMAHHWHSMYLMAVGRTTDALAENDRAMQLDPFSFPVHSLRGNILLDLREYDQATDQFEKMIAINSTSPSPYEEIFRVEWIEGRVSEAMEEQKVVAKLVHSADLAREAEEVTAVFRRAGLHAAQAMEAQFSENRALRSQRAETTQPHDLWTDYSVALRYGVLGNREKTLEWLDKAMKVRTEFLASDVISAPELDFLRSDPRFQSILGQGGYSSEMLEPR